MATRMRASMDICSANIFSADEMNILNTTDKYWHLFIIGKSNSRLIHNTEILVEGLFERKNIISLSIIVFFWIFRVDTIDFGSLDDAITSEFEGSEDRCRICRKVWISSSSYRYYHSPLFKMPDRPATNKIFCNSLSWNSWHHSHRDSEVFNRLSDSDTIDDSCEHPHIIPSCPIESSSFQLNSTKDISSSNDYHHFQLLIRDKMNNFFCYKGEKFWINTVSLLSLESLTWELEKDSFGCMIFFHRYLW